ncbi:MAG: metal ABC transporter ATP-binding protein [Methylacidiphilales bacterium]|nr:metal ABC transporter ATP-binding protein [Candidatus Methylacidiphilales bacterium]MDW8349074.1 metal ABC transporter ATP-binding protein [Verrucomicrobiae bacterium]
MAVELSSTKITPTPWQIRLTDVTAGWAQETVLQKINLTIQQGDILAIIGPNGGGKTTLLHVILGLIKPTSGHVEIQGSPRLGYLPQRLLDDRHIPVTVFEWLQVCSGTFSPFHCSTTSSHIEDILRRFLLHPIAHKRLDRLSGGELQRVMLAASFIQNPDLLILDEPTTGVDPAKETALEDILKREILDSGLSLIVVSHDLHWISRIAKKILCLNRSHFALGDASEMLREHILSSLYGWSAPPPSTHPCCHA